ncbi:MAG: hypothetical protein Q8L47_01495 [bacterium]|nr:hypothetical protein [bacterium]
MTQRQNGSKRESWNIDKPTSKTENQEFGKGEKGIIICGVCGAAHFKKRWYHGLEKINSENQNLPVVFKLCPACIQIQSRQYEGRIILENVPKKFESEITNFVNAYGKRAYDRDPMHRVIALKKNKEGLMITTTENQLALKLSRKLKQMFAKVVKDISFSPGPSDVVYITIKF